MDIHEFKLQVQRTMPNLGSLLFNSIHMTLGMGSEIYDEFISASIRRDQVNIAEELADAQWYICNYATLHEIPLSATISLEYVNEEHKLLCSTSIGRLQDFDKKALCYGKVVEPALRAETLLQVLKFTEWLAQNEGVDMNQARERVIAKLKHRYPEKFDTEKAINRDTVTERRILEGGDA